MCVSARSILEFSGEWTWKKDSEIKEEQQNENEI